MTVWNGHRVVLTLLYLVGLGAVAWFAVQGADYYRTPLVERPRHPLYWSFKPGGTWGLRFGIVGAGMMTLMLGYTLRKRWHSLRHLGTMRQWLDVHIFLGICGPLFIVLHSSFKVGGLVGLSFWSMVVVALSGVVGRYLYHQVPRTQAGDALSLEEVEARERELSRELVEKFGLPPTALEELETIAGRGVGAHRPTLLWLLTSPVDGLGVRWRLGRFLRRFPGVEPEQRRRFSALVTQKTQLRRRLVLWTRLRRVFHYWHVLHKPFAIIMYLFMVLHIGVAWWTGYV